jgi:hypothetical protein
MIETSLNEHNYVDIKKINNETSKWLQGKGRIPKYLEEMDEDNPVFSRSYSNKKDFTSSECKIIEKQISFFKDAKYVVMGHSRFKKINAACNKMLIRTDVSLSRAFGGNLSDKSYQALEILQHDDKQPELNIITSIKKFPL